MTLSRVTLKEEQIDTDVLVVGAGAGGMMAAITAADNGARVILCEKGCTSRSGGLPGGNDHFYCYIPGVHSPTYRSNFIKNLMSSGIVDEDKIINYVDLTYSVLQKWEGWGIDMKVNGRYEFMGHSWPGSSGEPGKTDRTQLHFFDPNSSVKLEKQVKKRGIHIINRVMVTELLKDANGHVTGAIGISTREEKLYIFKTRTIIINKGGVIAGRIYPPPNVIGYSMAEVETGDGVMMAYRAGADLQNAEFFRRQISLRFGPKSGKGTWVGVARDSEGKPIAPPYLTKPDIELGDKAIENVEAVDLVWETGKAPVWMDPRGISEEDERYMRRGFESEALLPFLKWLDREKIDIAKTRFEFIGMQPGTNIQARVNTSYETTVKGLYMILPGPLSRSAVGGMIAGEAAAKEVTGIQNSNLDDHTDTILHFKEQYEEIRNREGSQFADWHEAQWAIYQIMHCYALPPHRTENTLLAGYNQLLRLRELAKLDLKASNPHDLYHCLEVLNLINVAELVLLAIIERKESRGQAQRQDYPFTNPMMNKFLVINQKNGKPTFRWEKQRRVSE